MLLLLLLCHACVQVQRTSVTLPTITSPTSGVYLQQVSVKGAEPTAACHMYPAARRKVSDGSTLRMRHACRLAAQPPVDADGSAAPAFDWLHVYEFVDALHHTTDSSCQPAVLDECCAVAPARQQDGAAQRVSWWCSPAA
jgi:hypothetical protein